MSNFREWLSQHAQWIAGGIIAAIVAWYLVMRPKSTSAPSQISFPAQGGGGGGASPTPPPSPPTPPGPAPAGLPCITMSGAIGQTDGQGGCIALNPTAIQVPYAPDFGILTGITDAALRLLYEKEYNLELQINQATLSKNDPLVASLTGALQAIQQQISSYQAPVPPSPVTPPAPSPAPNPVPPPPAPPGGTTYTPFTYDQFAHSLDTLAQWFSLSPNATFANRLQAWMDTWSNYQLNTDQLAFLTNLQGQFAYVGSGTPNAQEIAARIQAAKAAYISKYGTYASTRVTPLVR